MQNGGGLRNELTKQPSPYTIHDDGTLARAQPETATSFVFSITRAGEPVRGFDVEHEKLLHFILVRNDLDEFQHLHPEFEASTGRFTVPVTFAKSGTYALFTDFTPSDDVATVLRKDVVIGAATTPTTPAVDDGPQTAGLYTVVSSVASPIPANIETMLVFEISKDGRPVADLQNYLGAKGHAVILAAQSLEYFHTHPADGAGHGDPTQAPGLGEVHFAATLPEPGRYKVFAQFRPEGELITVANVYEVTPTPEGIDLDVGHGEGHTGAEPAAREIRIEAFQYSYAPNEVRVKVGEPVEFVLRSRDVAHSFSVEGLGLNATILPDKETRLAFIPEQAGRYRFGCDVYCGEGHLDMSAQGGNLIVE